MLVWRNCVHTWRLDGTKRPCVVRGKCSVDVLLVGAVFHGYSVNKAFSEPVASAKWSAKRRLERGSTDQSPGTSSQKKKRKTLKTTSTCCNTGVCFVCFFLLFRLFYILSLGKPKAFSFHGAEHRSTSQDAMF